MMRIIALLGRRVAESLFWIGGGGFLHLCRGWLCNAGVLDRTAVNGKGSWKIHLLGWHGFIIGKASVNVQGSEKFLSSSISERVFIRVE